MSIGNAQRNSVVDIYPYIRKLVSIKLNGINKAIRTMHFADM